MGGAAVELDLVAASIRQADTGGGLDYLEDGAAALCSAARKSPSRQPRMMEGAEHEEVAARHHAHPVADLVLQLAVPLFSRAFPRSS